MKERGELKQIKSQFLHTCNPFKFEIFLFFFFTFAREREKEREERGRTFAILKHICIVDFVFFMVAVLYRCARVFARKPLSSLFISFSHPIHAYIYINISKMQKLYIYIYDLI